MPDVPATSRVSRDVGWPGPNRPSVGPGEPVQRFDSSLESGAEGPRGVAGPPGAPGGPGAPGDDARPLLALSAVEAPGANCPHGGTRVAFGYDLNLDGTLGNAEGQGVYYVCAGADGANGTNGVNGTPGTNGTNGSNGADGDQFGVVVRLTEAGFPCSSGGLRVSVGHDSGAGGGIANDGILQDGEVDSRSQITEGCALDCVGINVTSTANAGPGTLRQAIADANASGGADTICVPSGNYLLTSGSLVVTDESARGVIIDGNDAGGVFEIAAGVSGTFDNITVTGANTGSLTGGGFHVDGSVTLTECTVTGNTANFGAGIRLSSGDASALVSAAPSRTMSALARPSKASKAASPSRTAPSPATPVVAV